MPKVDFREQLSQLLSSYMQQEKPSKQTVAGFAAFLAPASSEPTGESE